MMKDTSIPLPPTLPPSSVAKGGRAKTEGGKPEPPALPLAGQALPAGATREMAAEPTPAPPSSVMGDLPVVVESLNDYLQTVQRELQFAVDETSGRTIITVMDRESQEIIRQIPPEAVLALADVLRDEGRLQSFGLIEQA